MRTSSIIVLAALGLAVAGCKTDTPAAPYGAGGPMSAPPTGGVAVARPAANAPNVGSMVQPTPVPGTGITGVNNVGASQGAMQPPVASGPGVTVKTQ